MEKSDTLITMHKIPIFSFTCLIGYFYKQDAGWKMVQLGCNEISLLHSYFTAPEPLLAWDGRPGIATERTPSFVGVNNKALTARMLAPWFPFLPPAPELPVSVWLRCAGPLAALSCVPTRLEGQDPFWGAGQLEAPCLRNTSPFSTLAWAASPDNTHHCHSPGCPGGPGDVLKASCLAC